MTKNTMTAEHWLLLEKEMRELAKARDCGCELAGLEPAMELVRVAAKRAAPDFAARDRGETLTELGRARIDLAYYALTIVATIVSKEGVLSMTAYDEHEAGRLALAKMFTRIRPYLERNEEQFHRATFDAECLFKTPDDCGGPAGITMMEFGTRSRGTVIRE